MSNLTDKEYQSIGETVEKICFVGFAKIDKDYRILWANKQFRKILGVTAGDILDVKFSDITPEPYRSQDIKNAKLVISGRISEYLMSKDFRLDDGRIVSTELLVNGIYCKQTGDFLYFISQLMPRENRQDRDILNQKGSKGLFNLFEAKKLIWTIISSLGLLIAIVIEKLLSK